MKDILPYSQTAYIAGGEDFIARTAQQPSYSNRVLAHGIQNEIPNDVERLSQ